MIVRISAIGGLMLLLVACSSSSEPTPLQTGVWLYPDGSVATQHCRDRDIDTEQFAANIADAKDAGAIRYDCDSPRALTALAKEEEARAALQATPEPTPTPTPSPTPTATPTPSPTPTVVAFERNSNALVYAYPHRCVWLRSEHKIEDQNRIICILDGEFVTIQSAPVRDDEYTWYTVTYQHTEENSGFTTTSSCDNWADRTYGRALVNSWIYTRGECEVTVKGWMAGEFLR